MTDRGRLLAACLTAAASASTAVSFAAGLPPAVYGDARPSYGRPQTASPDRGDLAQGRRRQMPIHADPRQSTAPPSAIVGFPSLAAPAASRPVGRQGAVREYARPAATGWVALVGEFGRQGCYEFDSTQVPLSELLRRCEGLTGQANGTLRLVRNGLAAGTINPQTNTSLRHGDILIAEGAGGRRFGVSTAGYEDRRGASDRPVGVRLGVVGATSRPLSIRLDKNKASVSTVIAGLRQNLAPRDVIVLVDGSRKVRGDQVTELTDGSVIVFDPQTVDVREASASDVESYSVFYPLMAPPAALPQDAAPADPQIASSAMPAAPDAEPQVLPLPTQTPALPQPVADMRVADASAAPQMSFVPPPPTAAGEFSALPQVESLEPPADEPPLGYPRTADASGSVPIGRPDVAESHITAVPASTFYPPAEPRIAAAAAAPVPPPTPEGSLGPASSLGPADSVGLVAEADVAAEEVSFGSLAATVLAGGALGAVTFLILRRLRGRKLLKRASETLRARIARPATPVPVEAPDPVRAVPQAAAPTDILAALVADRLAFREEAVELPTVLRIFGRSSALKKRRIDAAHAPVPEPHIPVAAPVSAEAPPSTIPPKSPKTNVRIDPAEPAIPGTAELTGGTPFERALAARRRAATH